MPWRGSVGYIHVEERENKQKDCEQSFSGSFFAAEQIDWCSFGSPTQGFAQSGCFKAGGGGKRQLDSIPLRSNPAKPNFQRDKKGSPRLAASSPDRRQYSDRFAPFFADSPKGRRLTC